MMLMVVVVVVLLLLLMMMMVVMMRVVLLQLLLLQLLLLLLLRSVGSGGKQHRQNARRHGLRAKRTETWSGSRLHSGAWRHRGVGPRLHLIDASCSDRALTTNKQPPSPWCAALHTALPHTHHCTHCAHTELLHAIARTARASVTASAGSA